VASSREEKHMGQTAVEKILASASLKA